MTIYVMLHNMFFMTIVDSTFFNIICFSFDGKTRVFSFGFLNEKQNKKKKTLNVMHNKKSEFEKTKSKPLRSNLY